MKTNRLTTLLDLLERKKDSYVPVRLLAFHCDVSEKTLRNDLKALEGALQEAGLCLEKKQGRAYASLEVL